MSRERILFLHENDSSFVRTDREILGQQFDVLDVDCSAGSTLRQVFRSLRGADLSYSWFGLGYAARAVLVGKLLRRPSVVVAGGWDVASMPEIGYGAVRSRRGRVRARLVLRRADVLITFSDWSHDRIRALSGREATVVYLGVDSERFRPHEPKQELVVSVGNVTRENLKRKGMETFVRAAALVPDVPFILVGAHADAAADELRQIATPNVSIPGRLSDESLSGLLGRAKVYVQTSYTEGFGLAVAEAMAAGCVPVVTRSGALPEVVGHAGFYVRFGDPQSTAGAIRDALASSQGAAARQRIRTLFSLARRRERLLEIVNEALKA